MIMVWLTGQSTQPSFAVVHSNIMLVLYFILFWVYIGFPVLFPDIVESIFIEGNNFEVFDATLDLFC
jgi:nitrate/nitrite transporter NarK